jgi:hypothetical protein
MMREFRIQPTIKHYGCMVDLGRAGYLEEVEQLVTMMPIKADMVLWGSILSAAREQGNVGLGEKAAEELPKARPNTWCIQSSIVKHLCRCWSLEQRFSC